MKDVDIRKTPPGSTLSQEITRVLMRRLVDEVYPPGSKLPTERVLAQEFGVTRHVVREALKRLEALGMVRIRQGSGIQVENLQLSGGAALFESLLSREDGTYDRGFLRDFLEFRAEMVRTVIRLAARNRTEQELQRIRELVYRRREVLDDIRQLNAINTELMGAIANATHNRVYQLMFNTFGKLLVELRARLNIHPDDMVLFQHLIEQTLAAIEQQDEEMAELLTARHMNQVRFAMRQLLDSTGE